MVLHGANLELTADPFNKFRSTILSILLNWLNQVLQRIYRVDPPTRRRRSRSLAGSTTGRDFHSTIAELASLPRLRHPPPPKRTDQKEVVVVSGSAGDWIS
jgi:hypothetical protein